MATPIPALECDLVMKGGVTSGIVYPAAISEIARLYRLRSVGGTSAGAIGAGAAAAMEFGRQTGRNPESPMTLARLSGELGGAAPDGTPLLLTLFEPDESTGGMFRLLMRLASAAQARGSYGAVAELLLTPFLIAALTSALAALALLVASKGIGGLAFVLALLLVLVLGTLLLTIILGAYFWIPKLRAGFDAAADNGFGFCSGMARYKPKKGDEAPSLSEWLHRKFQTLAGLPEEEPLCFGDLWAAQSRQPGITRDQAFEHARSTRAGNPAESPDLALIERDISLSLVASDINRAQSVQLPFMRREDRLYARKSDLWALFPATVVDWMIAKARTSKLTDVDRGGLEADEFVRLPLPQDLPILFAVRMSLSFPFLFRAVRLYVIRRRTDGSKELAEIWLADGGITSNFPIHLFDAPIPGRPTFCLNLLYHDDELEPDRSTAAAPAGEAAEEVAAAADEGLPTGSDRPPEQMVYMLTTNRGRLSAYTRFVGGSGFSRLRRFGGRVITTARQWGDNQLIDIPGYRDRIVHIRMRPSEGGFNLSMDGDQIHDLETRGALAGRVIAERFLPTATQDPLHKGDQLVLNWANHRMVRFRSFLAALEVMARRFAATWTRDMERAELEAGDPLYVVPSIAQMTEEARPGMQQTLPQQTGYPFRSNDQADLALNMVEQVRTLNLLSSQDPNVGIDFVHGRPTSPRPKTGLKVRPPGESDPYQER